MRLIPVDGEEIAITIDDRAQLEAVIGSHNLTQIGVSGGKVLVFSDEIVVERDGEQVYPQRNARASKLRGKRVCGMAVMGSPYELDFDKYEAVETMECRRCRATVPAREDGVAICDACFSGQKQASGVWTVGVILFLCGWILGFGVRAVGEAGGVAVAPPVGAAGSVGRPIVAVAPPVGAVAPPVGAVAPPVGVVAPPVGAVAPPVVVAGSVGRPTEVVVPVLASRRPAAVSRRAADSLSSALRAPAATNKGGGDSVTVQMKRRP